MHDAERQAAYLRQVLAQPRRPLGLLVGAGAPVAIRVDRGHGLEGLIPDVAGLTTRVKSELESSDLAGALETLVEQLPKDANIEQLLTHARSLRAVAGDDEIRGLSGNQLSALDASMCRSITMAVEQGLPPPPTPYHRLASWIASSERIYPVEMFTPNYDLLLEQALEDVGVPYFDGFVGSRSPFFDSRAIEQDELPPRWVRLWKLHGSINWSVDSSGSIRRIRADQPGDAQLIYPSHLKYDESRRMPYLIMIDRIRAFLRHPSAVLVTVGFSLRDDHLNDILVQGLQGNSTATAFALLHGELGSYEGAVALATKRPNLSLLARDEAVIGTRRSHWSQVDEAPLRSDPIAVQWEATGEQVQSRFMLGDFDRLGDFFTSVMGQRDALGTGDAVDAE